MRKLVALDLPCGDLFLSNVKDAWDAGDAVLPLDQRFPHEMKERIVKQFGASIVISERGESLVSGTAVESEDALVITTSGTSASPKGVVLSHEALTASSQMTSSALSVDHDSDVWLCCLPVSHISGFSVISRALHTGTRLELHSSFDAASCEQAGHDGVSLVSLVPAALNRVDATAFRKILVGGSSMPSKLPANAVQTYGMTETGSGVVYDGFPLDKVKLDIRNGEIFIQSPSLFRTYRGEMPSLQSGWFATGDAGHIAESGKLVVSGRLDDAIITGGEKVWPALVERHLLSLQLFREVMIVGRPDDEWGQVITAVAVLLDPNEIPKIENIRERLNAFLPRFALPKAIEIVESLPRNHSGKLLRKLV